jgi:hypothetical protein
MQHYSAKQFDRIKCVTQGVSHLPSCDTSCHSNKPTCGIKKKHKESDCKINNNECTLGQRDSGYLPFEKILQELKFITDKLSKCTSILEETNMHIHARSIKYSSCKTRCMNHLLDFQIPAAFD